MLESKDPLVRLEASKSITEDLFKDLLNEMKGFKYQITLKVLLSKHKINEDIEYAPVYFNSASKTIVNFDDMILINLVKHVNISMYSPLIENTYIELPDKLKNPMKDLINIKNNDNKCFLCCHIRHLNLVKRHPGRITKVDKKMINDLDYEGIKFPVSKKDYCLIERKKQYL